ncbi:hypothetical protein NADFUDRAFT_43046 [Nadsonia fulvescens var. elongata DSM 6958]|uniref:Centromere protein K n=1 Tax=Nadsonia fulvescens var. elongata DSM 6958 TaxID=857566 RepID=A0A1E3PH55_9ASCO|nr:hypothetical protein NADFUDRAFT_43046 [Nadsonia fulvescens var. elongata DSM 6958]
MSFEKMEAQSRRLRHQLREYTEFSELWKLSLENYDKGHSYQNSPKNHMTSVDDAIKRLRKENDLLAEELGQLNPDIEDDELDEESMQCLHDQEFLNQLKSWGKTPEDIITPRDKISLKKSYIGLKIALNSLPYEPSVNDPIDIILTRNGLENVISTSRDTLSNLKSDETKLKQDLEYDNNLNAELLEINHLLKERLQKLTINTGNGSRDDPKKDLEQLNKKISIENEKAVKYMGYLNHVLNSNIFNEVINEESENETDFDSDSSSPNYSSFSRKLAEIRETVEDLLNALFDSSAERYILPYNPESPIIRLLLQADLIIQRPDDPRYVKLRDYSECFE